MTFLLGLVCGLALGALITSLCQRRRLRLVRRKPRSHGAHSSQPIRVVQFDQLPSRRKARP